MVRYRHDKVTPHLIRVINKTARRMGVMSKKIVKVKAKAKKPAVTSVADSFAGANFDPDYKAGSNSILNKNRVEVYNKQGILVSSANETRKSYYDKAENRFTVEGCKPSVNKGKDGKISLRHCNTFSSCVKRLGFTALDLDTGKWINKPKEVC